MNWYQGGIAEAVAHCKTKDAIFVVYIEGQDEMSTNLTTLVNNDRVRKLLESDDFVAIKVEADSQAYVQFMAIYKVVPVPSIFFIGRSGTPLDIGTGVIGNVNELVQKIEAVLKTAGRTPKTSEDNEEIDGEMSTSAQAAATAAIKETDAVETLPAPPELRTSAGGDSQHDDDDELAETHEEDTAGSAAKQIKEDKTEKEEPSVSLTGTSTAAAARVLAATSPAVASATGGTTVLQQTPSPAVNATKSEDRLAKVQQLIEQKRAEQQQEELQRQQHQQELKNLQETIRRDRLAAQEERDRIRAQIAADRAERAQANRAFEPGPSTSTASASILTDASLLAENLSIGTNLEETRLQLRLPGGLQRTRTFGVNDTLRTVRDYVHNELLTDSNAREFRLATTYPRREFSLDDDEKTLIELNLVPNAVLLVLNNEHANRIVRNRGVLNMLAAVLWAMITPAAKAFDYVSNMGFSNVSRSINERLTALGWKRPAGDYVDIQREMREKRARDSFIAPSAQQSTAADPVTVSSAGTERTPEANKRNYSGEATIHRLRDTNKSDDEDKSTYNGNSTQQQ